MIKNKQIEDYLEGSFKTIEQELLKFDTKEEIENFVKWTLDKLRMNYNFAEEEKLRQEIKSETNPDKIGEIQKTKRQYTQKDRPYTLVPGDIVNVKFGVGVGHEISSQHYAVILSRKGTMFLIAPLTSQYQDYGKNTKYIKDLNLPREDGKPTSGKDISYISFSQIRYIHCRRITKIKRITGEKTYQEKRTISYDEVKDILDKWNDIIAKENNRE